MKVLNITLVLVFICLCTVKSLAHSNDSNVHFLGNAGVMIVGKSNKILFDPFFHNHYGQYSLVPESIRQKIFNNELPYEDIDAVFISHIHDDHFDAKDLVRYMNLNTSVKLFVPAESRRQLDKQDNYSNVDSRITYVDINLGQEAVTFLAPSLTVDAVFIPHAGWPKMSVQNIVFRVASHDDFTVMHLGDVGSKNKYFETHKVHWQQRKTHLALVPFWLGLSQPGYRIIDQLINADTALGVHVPEDGHPALGESGLDHFIIPGDSRFIATSSHPSKDAHHNGQTKSQ